MSHYKVLSPEQIEQFTEDGFTYLRNGFTRAMAEPVIDQVWKLLPAEMGIDRAYPSTWRHKHVGAANPSGPEVAALYTQRVRDAFDDLLGQGRWVERGEATGSWPFTFPGFDEAPWDAQNWHVDGGGQRFLNQAQQGLIAIMLFSDIGPGDGGTAVRIGSNKTTARVLQEAGAEGLSGDQYQERARAAAMHLPYVEAQGEVGDLVLCDGFVLHSTSKNLGSKVRIITNNAIHLREPMNFKRGNAEEYSARERSIMRAVSAL